MKDCQNTYTKMFSEQLFVQQIRFRKLFHPLETAWVKAGRKLLMQLSESKNKMLHFNFFRCESTYRSKNGIIEFICVANGERKSLMQHLYCECLWVLSNLNILHIICYIFFAYCILYILFTFCVFGIEISKNLDWIFSIKNRVVNFYQNA